jgi:type I restriction enzyme S subunit
MANHNCRVSDILPSHILSTQINRYAKVPKEFSDKFPLTILRSKDLVMAVRGDTTGKVGLVPDELIGSNISPNLIRISPNSTVLNPYYFFSYMLLASSIFFVYITNTAKKSITAKNIKSIPIFIPPMSLQDQFGIMISRILIFDEHRLTSHNRLEELFSTLLHHAFSSELTVTWREAHMQELLAEIE